MDSAHPKPPGADPGRGIARSHTDLDRHSGGAFRHPVLHLAGAGYQNWAKSAGGAVDYLLHGHVYADRAGSGAALRRADSWRATGYEPDAEPDRKRTRLNSSNLVI